ncbi:prenyltransferase [Glaciecola sp. 1036]|uniref:prenyltransferase n=1 Tax=Alteromonadaceae TaxID=72275 RepID=UPI003D02B196
MIRTLFATARPPFLVLAPLCVLVALAYASHKEYSYDLVSVVLCFIAAVLAHASVNMLNEYQDFKSNLDTNTQRTPFSGGSGALPINPKAANAVKWTGYLLAVIVFCIGLFFVIKVSWVLIPLGLLGLACVLFYTPLINRMPILCLIAPGIGFGLVMVVGSFFVMTGSFDDQLLIYSIPVFCLVNNLLLLNQYPDVEADKQAGRKHFIIFYGEENGKWMYLLQWIIATYTCFLILTLNDLPNWSYLLLVLMSLGLFCFKGLSKYLKHRDIRKLIPFMGINVIISLAYPLLMSVILYVD